MPCYYFDPTLVTVWQNVRGVLNSEFISAFLSALAGAGLGVFGAQRLSERFARRKELVDALRQANAIVVLAATIANTALRLKSQHIGPMASKYFENRKTADALNEKLLQGQLPSQNLRYELDLIKVTPVVVPIDSLKQLIFSTHTIPGKAVAISAEAEQAAIELNHAISARTEQAEAIRNSRDSPELQWQAYFGLKRRDGNIDSMYHDSMVAISSYTDDLAFFCAELAKELQDHATLLYKKIVKFAPETPKPSSADFSGPISSGLMPPREKYASWLAGFTKPA